MKITDCPVCAACKEVEGLEDGTRRLIEVCICDGRKRFAVCGDAPADGREAKAFFFAMLHAFELSTPRGRKKNRISVFDIDREIAERPGAMMSEIAGALGVSERWLQRYFKSIGIPFEKWQAAASQSKKTPWPKKIKKKIGKRSPRR